MSDATNTEKFHAFHEANPEVYEQLVDLALSLRWRGYSKFGISLIWERLRWDYMMEADDPSSEFKLNNNYRSFYARLLMKQEPLLRNVFHTRRSEADEDSPDPLAGNELGLVYDLADRFSNT